MNRRRLLCALFASAPALTTLGCMSVERNAAGYQRRGVWLPRHRSESYEGKEVLTVDGHELLFDRQRGVYVVRDLIDHYYVGGWFYRRCTAGWELSRSLQGPWVPVGARELPPGLRETPAP